MREERTFAAISTAPQNAAISVVRMSGPGALELAERVFQPAEGETLARRASHTLCYGVITGADGAVIDRAMAAVLRAPHT